MVDTGEGKLADKMLAAIRTLSAKPIQFIANTSFHAEHTGGNVALGARRTGPQPAGLVLRAVGAARRDGLLHGSAVARDDARPQQRDGAHAGAPARPPGAVPGDTYLEERRRKFHNGDAIEMFWQPNAVTDGDSIVHFRRADVIVAGDIFTTTQYPLIDVANGGSVQGGDPRAQRDPRAHRVPAPGRGRHLRRARPRLSRGRARGRRVSRHGGDRPRPREGDDRGGATLEQVKAARVTADYDTRYGATTGPWTTDMFVEAVYNSLKRADGDEVDRP